MSSVSNETAALNEVNVNKPKPLSDKDAKSEADAIAFLDEKLKKIMDTSVDDEMPIDSCVLGVGTAQHSGKHQLLNVLYFCHDLHLRKEKIDYSRTLVILFDPEYSNIHKIDSDIDYVNKSSMLFIKEYLPDHHYERDYLYSLSKDDFIYDNGSTICLFVPFNLVSRYENNTNPERFLQFQKMKFLSLIANTCPIVKDSIYDKLSSFIQSIATLKNFYIYNQAFWDTRAPYIVGKNGSGKDIWKYIDYKANRFFENMCELLSVGFQIKTAGKDVFLLDTVFQTYKHKNAKKPFLQKYGQPYNPKLAEVSDFQVIPLNDKTHSLGGRRTRHRKQKQKQRKTKKSSSTAYKLGF